MSIQHFCFPFHSHMASAFFLVFAYIPICWFFSRRLRIYEFPWSFGNIAWDTGTDYTLLGLGRLHGRKERAYGTGLHCNSIFPFSVCGRLDDRYRSLSLCLIFYDCPLQTVCSLWANTHHICAKTNKEKLWGETNFSMCECPQVL